MAEENDYSHRQKNAGTEDPPQASYVRKKQPPEADPGGRDPDDVDLRELFLVFWRRRFLIIFLVIFGALMSFYMTSKIEPVYTARAYVLIETERTLPRELSGFVRNLKTSDSLILSEAQIIKSRSFASKVLNSLDLKDDPDFNPDLQKTSTSPLNVFIAEVRKLFTYSEKVPDTSLDKEKLPGTSDERFKQLKTSPSIDTLYADEVEDSADARQARMINALLDSISVNIVSGTNVIYIEAESSVPKKAALLANQYADQYIKERLRQKFEETQKLSNWLDDRLEDLKKQVREDEKAVARYRVENNLITTRRGEITGEQLTQLNTELIRAKGDLAAKKARLEQTRRLDPQEKDIMSVPEVMHSKTIQNLKLQEIDLVKQRAELRTKYGDKHPSIININNEIEVLQRRMRAEARSIINGIKEEVLIAQARVEALESGFNSLINVRAEENEAMIRLRELMMEAESSRLTYDKFLQTYKRSTNQEKLQEAEARVISYAPVPLKPAYPNKVLFASLSSIFMLFVGIILALFLEKLDAAFKTVTQIEALTRVPCFGVVPESRMKTRDMASKVLWKKGSAHLAENVRNLRTTLNLRNQAFGKRPKVITVTSSLPGEGKSTLSTWLALIGAKSGDKVCLIDCDLREPVIHHHIKGRKDKTLVEFLTNQAEMDEILIKDKKTGLYTIFSKSVPNSALDLISSRKMQALIDSLRQEFDMVILDAPSCLSVSDPKILATLSDQTLYAVNWGRTEREQVMIGLKQFNDIGYNDIATVFTRVNLKNYAKLGYGEVGYYNAG